MNFFRSVFNWVKNEINEINEINGNREEIKKAKKMSLFIHAVVMLLVVCSFKFGLLVTSISIIIPQLFAIFAKLDIKRQYPQSNTNPTKPTFVDYVDVIMFNAHSLLLLVIRWLPVTISFPIMLLNLMVSTKYVACIIEVIYDFEHHAKVSSEIEKLKPPGAMFDPVEENELKMYKSAHLLTSGCIADASLFG